MGGGKSGSSWGRESMGGSAESGRKSRVRRGRVTCLLRIGVYGRLGQLSTGDDPPARGSGKRRHWR